MSRDWTKTRLPGIEYRLGNDRPRVQSDAGGPAKIDRYYRARFKVDGKLKIVSFGWVSEYRDLSETFCYNKSREYKANILSGKKPQSWQDELSLSRQKAETQEQIAKQQAELDISFSDFFNEQYMPSVEGANHAESTRKAREHVKTWLGPDIGEKSIAGIKTADLEKVRQSLVKAGRSPRTIQYVMATFRATWNLALARGLVTGICPSKFVKVPKIDNQRQRYLSQKEAASLLKILKVKSPVTHHMSLLSLHTGMRFSEITGMTWSCVDLERNQIHILNTKGKKDRTTYMTDEVSKLLSSLPKGKLGEFVFPSRTGGRIGKISNSFTKAVDDLKLNSDIANHKKKFTFHGLRHTHASWLVESGVQLYLIQKQLGHSTPSVTQRYAHVSDDQMSELTQMFQAGIEKKKSAKVIDLAEKRVSA